MNGFNVVYYSVLSATTGSFFAALLDGIMPDINVSNTLITTKIAATPIGNTAFRWAIPVRARSMILIGMHTKYVTITIQVKTL